MPLTHSPYYGAVNPRYPEPSGYCDRCSFLYKLSDLDWQYEYSGNNLVNRRLRVCPPCLDEPQPNGHKVFHFGPEPAPLKDPRPGNIPAQVPQGHTFVLDDDGADRLDIDELAAGGSGTVGLPGYYDVSRYGQADYEGT